jgi:hypothetical protein
MLHRCDRDPIQRSPHFRQIGPARVGQLNAAVLPPEQRRPEPVLEQLDMPADRSMRDAAPLAAPQFGESLRGCGPARQLQPCRGRASRCAIEKRAEPRQAEKDVDLIGPDIDALDEGGKEGALARAGQLGPARAKFRGS